MLHPNENKFISAFPQALLLSAGSYNIVKWPSRYVSGGLTCVTCSFSLLPNRLATSVAFRYNQGPGDAVFLSAPPRSPCERSCFISPAWKDIMGTVAEGQDRQGCELN